MVVRKETLNLDETRIEHVRRVLGARTETDPIHGALDWVLERQKVVDDLLAIAGRGKGKFRRRAAGS